MEPDEVIVAVSLPNATSTTGGDGGESSPSSSLSSFEFVRPFKQVCGSTRFGRHCGECLESSGVFAFLQMPTAYRTPDGRFDTWCQLHVSFLFFVRGGDHVVWVRAPTVRAL